jgi:excinuclease UvrABC nuclease subunit
MHQIGQLCQRLMADNLRRTTIKCHDHIDDYDSMRKLTARKDRTAVSPESCMSQVSRAETVRVVCIRRSGPNRLVVE